MIMLVWFRLAGISPSLYCARVGDEAWRAYIGRVGDMHSPSLFSMEQLDQIRPDGFRLVFINNLNYVLDQYSISTPIHS